MEFGNGRAIVLYSNAIIFPGCPEKKKEVEAILLDIMGIKEEAEDKGVLFNDLKTKLVDEKNKKEAEDKVVKVKSLTSEVTSLSTQLFKRSYKVSHIPGL